MAGDILHHYLTFSKEELEAFYSFKNYGSIIFGSRCNSSDLIELWGKACVSLTFIFVTRDYSLSSLDYTFSLNDNHIKSLFDMLWLIDWAKNNSSSNQKISCDKELMENFFNTAQIFKSKVVKFLDSTKVTT
jgi:hypothetical protein